MARTVSIYWNHHITLGNSSLTRHSTIFLKKYLIIFFSNCSIRNIHLVNLQNKPFGSCYTINNIAPWRRVLEPFPKVSYNFVALDFLLKLQVILFVGNERLILIWVNIVILMLLSTPTTDSRALGYFIFHCKSDFITYYNSLRSSNFWQLFGNKYDYYYTSLHKGGRINFLLKTYHWKYVW